MSIHEERWYEMVRSGLTVTFWLLLIPRALASFVGFALAIAGAGPQHLKWATLIHTAGGLGLLLGIVVLTTTDPNLHSRWIVLRAWVFRIVGLSELLVRLVHSGADFAGTDAIGALAVELNDATGAALVVAGAAYSLALTRRLVLSKLRREIWTAGSIFVVLSVSDWIIVIYGPEWYASKPLMAAGMLYGVSIAVWGLSILWRLRRAFRRVLQNECVACGYALANLPEDRCPECGTPVCVSEVGTR